MHRRTTARLVAALALTVGVALTAPIAAHAAVTLPGAVRIQQDVPGPSWVGTWTQSGTSAASGGTRAVGAGAGSTVTFAFQGTAVSVIGERGPGWGKVDVLVDGVKYKTVDLYAAKAVRATSIVKKTGLSSGRHTVTLVATGAKNARATSTKVNVDAVDIVGTAVAAATVKRVDEKDARLFWDGRWTSTSASSANGGTVRSASGGAAEMTIEFKGRGITVVGPRGPALGQATVMLDGKAVGTISGFSPVAANQRTLFSVAGLTNGSHYLTLRVRGTHDAASKGTLVSVDAFEVRQGDAVTGWVRAEDGDSRITHAGSWSHTANTNMSGGSYSQIPSAGGVVRARFVGTSVRIVAPKSKSYGQIEVICDGSRRVIDLYSSSTKVRQRVLTITGLDGTKQHNVEVRALGVKSSGASWHTSAIDAIDIRGTWVQAPAARSFTALEEDQVDVALSSAWHFSASTGASAGRVASVTGANHTARVTFTGPAARVFMKKGPSYGKAQVYVDGKVMATVDLYAPTTQQRQLVWQDAVLGDVAHTLTIKTLGTKHPNSTGTTVALDRVEVTGKVTDPPLPSGSVRLQEGDPRVLRTGVWSTYSSSDSSDGSHTLSRDCLAVTRVKFTGTAVSWVGSRSKAYGRAFVYLDGKKVATLDNYNYAPEYGRVLWKATGLKNTSHTLRIEIDDALARGSSYWVPIDAFDITGTPSQPTIVYDHDDYHVGSRGGWTTVSRSGAFGGSVRRASSPGTMTVSFSGTRVGLVSEVGPGWGVAHVSIDGGAPVDVNLKRTATKSRTTVFTKTGLAAGSHTLTFSWTAPKSHESTESVNRVNLDAVETGGPLLGATPQARARDIIVRTAIAQLGDPYLWGATGPDKFDCSGLVLYSYKAAGVSTPRVSRDQWAACSPKNLRISQLLPGDLVFRSSPSYIHHVGIYLGNGVAIHAPSSGRDVQYSRADAFACFGRMAADHWPTK